MPVGLRLVCVLAALILVWPSVYLFLRASMVDLKAVQGLLTPGMARIVGRSLALVLAVNGVAWLIALPLAWLSVYADIPGRRIWTVLVALPLAIPSYIGAYVLIAMYGPRGLLQQWLAPLGVERLPSLYGFPGALVVLVLHTYPYLFLLLRSAMRQIDQSWIDASRTLGHGVRRTFWRVQVPLIRPALAAGTVLVSLYVLRDFGAVSLLRYTTFTRAIFVLYEGSFDRHQAALLTLVLVCLILLLLALARRVRGGRNVQASHAGSMRSPTRVRLGRWSLLAYPLLGGVVFMGLINPVAVSSIWLVKGLRAGESLQPLRAAMGSSLYAALLAAVTGVLLALPISYAAERYGGRVARLATIAADVGFGMPGIAIALSLVFFGARHTPWLYQTMYLLTLGYMVQFLAVSLGSLRTQLGQINPRIEEAGRLLGLGANGVLARITVPLLRRGMLAGAALVYLNTMKELPLTLLLAPTGFSTLATRIWAATEEAFFARAAAPTLILLLVSALGIAFILNTEEL